MNADQAWQATLGQLQMDMSKAAYDTWVKNSKLVNYREGQFTIGVPNSFARDWLETRMTITVNRVLTGIMNLPQKVNFIIYQKDQEPTEEQPESISAPAENRDNSFPVVMTRPARSVLLNSKYTFQSFVVGPGNRFAHAASMAVADNPAHAYNPLFLYGGVGLGKTHLLHAIGNQCLKNGLNVLYITSEEFTNDLIQAIRNHSTPEFREKYRQVDVLLIDDIQFIAGKESTQEEFFHTFNALHSAEKQIVICSDRPPKALMTLEERLRSRFEWGLIADIQAPDLETRVAILRSKAEKVGHHIPNDVTESIAKRFQGNIRELEGALNRVLAFSDLSGLPINQSLVNSALADLMPHTAQVEPKQIVSMVASVFKISQERLLSRDRSQEVALPRQLAMYLMREDTGLSLPQIGHELGGRDHTTVMYACEKMTGLMNSDDRLRKQATRVRELLYGTG
jgi:chromosomal replication initiator protein